MAERLARRSRILWILAAGQTAACHKLFLLYSLYKIAMIATKRVAVTEPVWAELSDLRKPGETFSQLLAEMIEREKKSRLIEHLKKIADEGDFVELPP
jgi:predicted CopG family antitoxin